MRKFIFWLHLIAGVVAGAIILVMSVTGTLMAFEPQIVEFSEKKIRFVEPAPDAERLSIEEVVRRVGAEKGGALPNAVVIRSDPKASMVLMYGRGGGVFVDPYTAAVLGRPSKTHDFMHWIEDIHRRLGAKDAGKRVTGACTLAFLFLILTGVYLWRPKKWTASHLKPIAFFGKGLKGKQRDWNWHNVIGLWLSPVLLATAVTGLVMSYTWANDLLFRLTGNEPPPAQGQRGPGMGGPGSAAKPGEPGARPKTNSANAAGRPAAGPSQAPPPAVLPAAGLDAVFKEVSKLSNDWSSISLRLGVSADAPMTVQVGEKSPTVELRSQATVDTRTGKVIQWEPFEKQNLGRKSRFWFRYLHTGELLGPLGQLLMGIGAAGAAVLVYTGFALALRRFGGWLARKRPAKRLS